MRRVLYLSDRYQALYELRRRMRLAWDHHGPLKEADWSQLDNLRVRILADLIEEEFRLDHIPHIVGPDHRALVARKRRQLFHDEPFVAVTKLGREEDGRRDDLLLFSAIRDRGDFGDCLKLLAQGQNEVEGIWSLPRLSESWLKLLPPMSQGLLVLVNPVADQVMLRQCFCRSGRVIFSRLSIEEAATLGTHSAEEIERTYRYLVRTPRLPGEGNLPVQVLAPKGLVKEFQDLAGELPGFELRCVELGELAPKLGWRGEPGKATVPALAAARLGRQRWLFSHYQSQWQRSLQRHRRLRLGVYGGTGGLMLAATAFGAYAWLEGRQLEAEKLSLIRQQASLQKLLQNQPEPETIDGFDPWQIETAWDLQQQVNALRLTPAEILEPVSQALDQLPGLTLMSVAWQRRPQKDENDALQPRKAEPLQLELALQVADEQKRGWQGALDLVQRFTRLLARQPAIARAVIAESPLPTDPASTVSGELGTRASAGPGADFKVTAEFGQAHED